MEKSLVKKKTKSLPEVEVKSNEEAESSADKSGGDVDKDMSVDQVPKKFPTKKKGKQGKNVNSTSEIEVKSDVEAKNETEKSGDEYEDVSGSPVKKKKGKKPKSTPEVEEKSDAETEGESKKILIEHCKQCNSFKTRANQVTRGLENVVSGITVLLKPVKPRKGCFEIREEGGQTFISLLNSRGSSSETFHNRNSHGTVITAVIYGGHSIMVYSDTLATCDTDDDAYASKMFEVGRFVFGASGSSWVAYKLLQKLHRVVEELNGDTRVEDLADWLRKTYKKLATSRRVKKMKIEVNQSQLLLGGMNGLAVVVNPLLLQDELFGLGH